MRSFIFFAAICCLVFALSGCAMPRVAVPGKPDATMTNPPPFTEGQLVLPSGEALADADFADFIAGAAYVLAGERHDAPGHHLVQARLLSLLAQAGRKPLLGIEMVPASLQKTLDRFNAGRLSPESLPRALDWQKTWGFDYALYHPIFATARRTHAPAYGLNVPRSLIAALRRAGGTDPAAFALPEEGLSRADLSGAVAALSAEEKSLLPSLILPPSSEQAERLRRFFAAHMGMKAASPERESPPASIRQIKAGDRAKSSPHRAFSPERFLFIQSLWDSAMAEKAALTRKGSGKSMLILAGGGHVEYGWGIARRLRVFDPGAKILVIMPFSGAVPPDPDMADLFFYERSEGALPPQQPGEKVFERAPPSQALPARG